MKATDSGSHDVEYSCWICSCLLLSNYFQNSKICIYHSSDKHMAGEEVTVLSIGSRLEWETL